MAKELGDVAWYIAEAATALDISLEDIFQANIDKLKRRYFNLELETDSCEEKVCDWSSTLG